MIVGLTPWTVLPAWAENDPTVIAADTTNWSGNMAVNSDITVAAGMTYTDGTTVYSGTLTGT